MGDDAQGFCVSQTVPAPAHIPELLLVTPAPVEEEDDEVLDDEEEEEDEELLEEELLELEEEDALLELEEETELLEADDTEEATADDAPTLKLPLDALLEVVVLSVEVALVSLVVPTGCAPPAEAPTETANASPPRPPKPPVPLVPPVPPLLLA